MTEHNDWMTGHVGSSRDASFWQSIGVGTTIYAHHIGRAWFKGTTCRDESSGEVAFRADEAVGDWRGSYRRDLDTGEPVYSEELIRRVIEGHPYRPLVVFSPLDASQIEQWGDPRELPAAPVPLPPETHQETAERFDRVKVRDIRSLTDRYATADPAALLDQIRAILDSDRDAAGVVTNLIRWKS